MNALVTGGGGFLGGAIVRRLVARGDAVRSLARGHYPPLEALGVEQHRGDVADEEAVAKAAEGCEVVFHVAAKVGLAGPYAPYHRVNVAGTGNVLAACRAHGIRRLIYTSSPSVVFDGRDQEGIDESAPYPPTFEAVYPQTKALAECLVRAANGPSLATVALRPHLVWGPGDTHLVPRILERGRAGRLRRVGGASKLIDSVYVDNAAEAHLLAADALAPGSPVAGKVYFISNGEPLPLWDLVNSILAAGGVPPVTRTVPFAVAFAAGWVLEKVYALLGWEGDPPMTRVLARELTTAHWFDISAARRDLGYEPRVSVEEGLRRLGEWLKGAPPPAPLSPASGERGERSTLHPEYVTMKTALHSVSYAGAWPGQARLPLDDFLVRARALGFGGVMLMAKRPHLSVLDHDADARRALRRRVESLGLEVACLAGYTDFCAGAEHPEVPLREVQTLYVRELCRLAADLGCPLVRVFTGYDHAGTTFDQRWAWCVGALKECARLAAPLGVTVGVQNHHDVAGHWQALLDLLAEVGEPNCKACFDAWAPALHGDDLVTAARQLAPHTAYTTVADYVRRRRFRYRPELVNFAREEDVVRAVPMGEGFIDYRGFFRALREARYGGWVAYEMCSPLRGGGSEENLDSCARRFLEYVREL